MTRGVTVGRLWCAVLLLLGLAACGGGAVGSKPQLPDRVTGLTATAGNGAVTLNWPAAAHATAYRVKRSTTAGGPYAVVTTPAGPPFTDSGLSNGVRVYYVVAAINGAGEAADSAEAGATPQADVPAAPAGLVALGLDGQVRLSWSEVSGATGYRIRRASAAAGPFVEIGTATRPLFSDTGRSNGTTLYYVVSALGSSGESGSSAVASATPSPALPVLPAADASRNAIGMNVWYLADWDDSFAFVDAMKHARPWQDAADWHQPVAGVDALGWPTADASTVVMTGTPAQINGTYTLVFEGQAEVSLLWSAGSVSGMQYDPATNTSTAQVSYAQTGGRGSVGLVFRNTRRTAGSAVNTGFAQVRLYRPGYPADGSQVFTTPFLDGLRKTQVVRMMDWTATNGNLTQHWSQRITPRHMNIDGPGYTSPAGRTWASSFAGVALEHQIRLCNTLLVDCWINIPVLADDEYVRKMALALRYGTDGSEPYTSPQAAPVHPPLDPALRLYLEYANETWNSAGGFLGFHVMYDIVANLPADHPVALPAEPNIWYRVWRLAAFRTAEISDIFRAVYGDASMMNRVRPLLMTQQGNGQATLSTGLLWLDDYARRQQPARRVSDYLYGAGGSGYYNPNTEPADKTDRDAFFAPGNYPSSANVAGFGIDSVWAANYGLRHVAYEGGPSLDNFGDSEARAINADPRMRDMVLKTHDAWSAQGGDLLVYYVLVGPPKWAFTPDVSQLATPKLDALDALRTQPRAAVTLGAALPGALVATDLMEHRVRTGYDFVTTCGTLPCLGGNGAGLWVAFPGHAATAYRARLTLTGTAYAPTTAAVWINGVRQPGELTLAAGSGLTESSALTVDIPAGLVVVRVEVLTGGLDLRAVQLPVAP